MGRKQSDETRRKISIAKTGVRRTAEAVEKSAAGHRGKVMSDESRAKMSSAQTGRKQSDETKDKLRQINLGKRHSAETKKKLSEAFTGRVVSDETRAKLSAAGSGRQLSDETRERISKAKCNVSPETRLKISQSKAGKPLSEEHKSKLRGRKLSPEHRAKMAAKRGKFRLAGPTSIERAVAARLAYIGFDFIPEAPFGPYNVDFLIPSMMCVIEADGDYWHSRPGVKARDARKDIYLAELGYRVWRFPEHDIKSGRAFNHPIFNKDNSHDSTAS